MPRRAEAADAALRACEPPGAARARSASRAPHAPRAITAIAISASAAGIHPRARRDSATRYQGARTVSDSQRAAPVTLETTFSLTHSLPRPVMHAPQSRIAGANVFIAWLDHSP